MATNTTNTFTNHTGNGTEVNFSISFSYILTSDIDVTVAGVLKTLGTHYTISGSTVTFTSGNVPANGAAIKFQRDTSISTKAVDFQDGSVLTEQDLDNNTNQVLFAQQEIIDKLGGIEEGATGDQTAAEIRAAVEAASDSNVFTDADHSKLNAIEASATADQTAAEIRTLVESASDSNVFTDADHTKLNGIEANATADQTAAEIRTLVESASDSNVFTDADHTKLNGMEAGATADQTITEIKNLIAGSPLDASHLAANSVTTSEIADAELTTLAGMQSGTASKLADSTALTSDIADLNQLDGMAKQTIITDDDTKFPTSGAVVDYVAAQIAPIGGLEVIANEDSFPTTQPASGVVISISDIEGLIVNGSGVATNARTSGNGSDNVTINGFPSSLQSKTMAAGLGLMVSSTGSSQTYTYHKLLAKEADVEQLSNDINDFAARYRVGSSNPTSELDAGDLFFNTSTSKLLVYNSTNSAWEEAQSIGNFFISTLSPAFNGSTQDFTITNAPANAQQILLSINGVVQKPNSGTSTPSEGFALSGSTVKLAAAPPTGSDYFAIVLGSTVNIGTPSNNTVSTAIIQNGAVTGEKLASNVDLIDNQKIRLGTGNDLEIYHDNNSSVIKHNLTSVGELQLRTRIFKVHSRDNSENIIKGVENGAVELYYNNSRKFETTSGGARILDNLQLDADNRKAIFGSSNDLQIYHDGTHSYIYNITGELKNRAAIWKVVNAANSEKIIEATENGSVDLYYDNSKKFETTSYGGIFGNDTSSGVASPVRLSLGGTYHTSAGGDPKLSVWTDGSNHMGFGVSSDQLDVILTNPFYDFVVYGGSGGTTERLRVHGDGGFKVAVGSNQTALNINSDGYVTKPKNPVFHAFGAPTNVAANNDIVFGQERFDVGGGYNTSTGVYTAPVTGYYHFYCQVYRQTDENDSHWGFYLDAGSGFGQISEARMQNNYGGDSGRGYSTLQSSIYWYMTAGHKMKCRVNNSSGDIHCNNTLSYFCGNLVG